MFYVYIVIAPMCFLVAAVNFLTILLINKTIIILVINIFLIFSCILKQYSKKYAICLVLFGILGILYVIFIFFFTYSYILYSGPFIFSYMFAMVSGDKKQISNFVLIHNNRSYFCWVPKCFTIAQEQHLNV